MSRLQELLILIEHNQDLWEELWVELVSAKLYVLLDEKIDVPQELKDKGELPMLIMQAESGEFFTPVFTSIDQLHEKAAEAHGEISGVDFFDIVLSSYSTDPVHMPVFINPFDDKCGLYLPSEDIINLAQHVGAMALQADDFESIEALLAQYHQDPNLYELLCSTLMTSDLYVVSGNGGDSFEEEETKFVEAGEFISIQPMIFENGERAVPVYTSLDELRKGLVENKGYLAMQGMRLFEIVAADNVVINPNTPNAVFFSSEEVKRILQHFQREEVVFEENREVILGIPEENPVALKDAIVKVLSKEPSVHAAYLIKMLDGETASIVVGLLIDKGFESVVFERSGIAAQPFLPEGHYLDMLSLGNSQGQSLEEFMLAKGDLFYEKAVRPTTFS